MPSLVARHQAEVVATASPSETAAALAAAAPAPQGTPEPSNVPLPSYFTYTIQPGDSVSSIAARYGVNEDYLVWNNPHLSADPDTLLVGATLVIPGTNGIVYNVIVGDTLNDIAAYYGVGVDAITGYGPNGVTTPDSVVEGMVLVIPGGVPPAPISDPASADQPIPAAVEPEPEPVYEEPEPAPAPAPSVGYIWPFYGPISTYFGWDHIGIDIDGFGNYGATIAAAASGTVVLASYDSYGYGYHVIIQHDDGSQTLYAHMSEIWVTQGQYVGQGQGVGALGNTGYSTGAHLMFNLYIGGAAVDPLAYLP